MKHQELKDARDEARAEQQRLLTMSEVATAEAAQLRAELGSREADLAEVSNRHMHYKTSAAVQKCSVLVESVISTAARCT
jgi:uncharacterized coiled-coil DUF342 family protein